VHYQCKLTEVKGRSTGILWLQSNKNPDFCLKRWQNNKYLTKHSLNISSQR